ncbi:zinc ribbon domain-containing protein [Thermosediminibacter oceani]|uniref:Putative regulatory protein FmdB zinc ribbon domain-containing protein n=1 Tax=Thermosediminibacter oceani (strain ATCC BAA-1034 / DSM 16646 / JW/IW-1228P) TaxID=555079 RepID=D9RY53_THEOJ|nr:zinc ribbon domain-containing protein [Thermosediminibacter oceani]ADL08277.1 hypothetical protein Toce_1532 [Thermosediminibacter oceani DSM 16646]
MPLYDFVCSDCNAKRSVIIDYKDKEGLELICVHCGGVMRASSVALFSFVKPGGKHPANREITKPCGHTLHCRCAAVKQKGPNPFEKKSIKFQFMFREIFPELFYLQ